MRTQQRALPHVPEVERLLTARELYDSLETCYGCPDWWSDDPYRVMFQSVLVQNTAWTIVEKVSGSIDPITPGWVSSVSQAELENAIKPCGMSRSKAATIRSLTRWFEGFGFDVDAVEDIPDDVLRRDLMSVRGIGAETADVIMLYSFHRPVFIVDAYARRMLDRLGYRFGSDLEIKDFFETGLGHDSMLLGRCHRLILDHCIARCGKKAACDGCPLTRMCRFGPQGSSPS